MPPDREHAWSERSLDSGSDIVHEMGDDEPQPEYGAKDQIDVFVIPRSEIAARWEESTSNMPAGDPCPMPWDVYDLDFSEPFAEPEYRGGDWAFRIVDGRLLLEMHELIIHVRTAGDLSAFPWSTKFKQGWTSCIGAAGDMFKEFTRLVSTSEVTLYESEEELPDTQTAVLFDTPIPSSKGARVLGWEAKQAQIGDAWRSTTKTFHDTCAPPWLRRYALCPSWWSQSSYHGRRQTLNAFADGYKASDCNDLAGGSDTASRVGTVPGGAWCSPT